MAFLKFISHACFTEICGWNLNTFCNVSFTFHLDMVRLWTWTLYGTSRLGSPRAMVLCVMRTSVARFCPWITSMGSRSVFTSSHLSCQSQLHNFRFSVSTNNLIISLGQMQLVHCCNWLSNNSFIQFVNLALLRSWSAQYEWIMSRTTSLPWWWGWGHQEAATRRVCSQPRPGRRKLWGWTASRTSQQES